MKKKKGFTLAELLIVVAIIAVLVAVSIPVFTSRLESSREAVDLANMRNAYGAARIAYLSGDTLSYSYTVGEEVETISKTFGVDDIMCVYDASNGNFVDISARGTIEGYGKGTAVKGGCEKSTYCKDANGDFYNETSDVKGKVILVYVYEDGSMDMIWN